MTDDKVETEQMVTLETTISASPETVWRALTEGIDAWWPSEFFTGGEEGKRSYHLEAEPGGRMYEEWENGGLLWAQVVTVRPNELLQVTGHAFPEWGGPSVMFATWKLEPDGEGCTLRFDEHVLGKTPDGYAADKLKGWTFLFDSALKAHVEGTPAPKWED